MNDPHEGLGTQRRFMEGICSHCDAPIPIDPVRLPLVIWADGGQRRWAYCARCEEFLLAKFATLKWP
jgi:hypothetical protein